MKKLIDAEQGDYGIHDKTVKLFEVHRVSEKCFLSNLDPFDYFGIKG